MLTGFSSLDLDDDFDSVLTLMYPDPKHRAHLGLSTHAKGSKARKVGSVTVYPGVLPVPLQ